MEILGGDADRQGGVHPVQQFVVVGLSLVLVGEELRDLGGDGFLDDLVDEVARDFGGEHFVAVAVNDLALHVHHVVEIEHALAPGVVALFDAFLGGFDGLVEPRVFECLAFLHAEALHHRGHAVGGGEVAHQVVFEGDEELRAAGVALAGATAAELAVDAAGFVALGADDEEAAELRGRRGRV